MTFAWPWWALPCPLSRSHFIYAIKWLMHWAMTSWGCVLHNYKRNVIDNQTKKDDREKV